jgi:hypothetical protein
MEWLTDMSVIVFVSLVNIAAAVFLGFYWLKNERYPWEKQEGS